MLSIRIFSSPDIGAGAPAINVAETNDVFEVSAEPHADDRRRRLSWIGLVPRQHSSGGRDRLGSILKKQILDFDRMILAWHRSNQTSKRVQTPS